MRVNYNLVTTVGSTYNERRLIHNLHVKEHWNSEKNYLKCL